MQQGVKLQDQRDNIMGYRFESKGDWDKTEKWLKQLEGFKNLPRVLEKYGREGVAALSAATPVDTGETASSWSYKIVQTSNSVSLNFVNNSKTKTGIPIAILLQYGHGNGRGGYVQGRDYINPAVQPIFDEIAEKAWKEVAE